MATKNHRKSESGPKISLTVAAKTAKVRHLFKTDEDFVEFRSKIQRELQKSMHGCRVGMEVYASNWAEETAETAEKGCPRGRLLRWEATVSGPVFYIEGGTDYYWYVFPMGKQGNVNKTKHVGIPKSGEIC